MKIPARILRAQADDLPGRRPRRTGKELEREDQIIATAIPLMARHGRAGMTLTGFAHALRMAPCTLKTHFSDLDALLAEILYRHLANIAAAIGAAKSPPDATIAQRRAARRAAYITFTRTPYSAPTEAHLILLRERHALPADLAGPIEDLRYQIGEMLADENADAALALMDTPTLQPPQIEAMLAAIPPRPRHVDETHPAPAPAPSPAATSVAPDLTNISFLPNPLNRTPPDQPGPRAGPH
jgi:AcrR family transcriptional regulator